MYRMAYYYYSVITNAAQQPLVIVGVMYGPLTAVGVEDIDGFVQERHNSIANALELHLFYASALRRRRHYVFGLSVRPSVLPSVRPSVRSLKYPLLTCIWVRWSTQPTVTVLRHVHQSVCLSVRPERFPGICRRMHGGNGLKFCTLKYLEHLQNW